jgi:Tol biopolymer transport system component
MSAMTRRLGASMVVGVLVLAGVAACGGSETPTATPTTPSSPATTTPPSPTPSPTPESRLTGPTVVIDRELSDGSRVLVAYDLDDGTTRRLTTLESQDRTPTVDAAGTAVVVANYPVPPNEPEPTSADHVLTSHLVLVDLSTGGRRTLTEQKDGVAAQSPQWNRVGDGWVYFTRADYTAHTSGLWRVDPSTGEVEEVPNGAGVPSGRFALEPGGRHVRADNPNWTDDNGTQHAGLAWRLDLTTGSISLDPFDDGEAGSIGDMAWTPDGTWLAYTRSSDALLIERWPDGTPRVLLREEASSTAIHLVGEVGWHPDGSVVVLQDTRLSWNTAEHPEGAEPDQVRQQVLLVDTTDGSATPIGPASVHDLSFDVWAPPATG